MQENTRAMTTTYSSDFKASLIAKMLPPNNVSVPELASETGIPKDTLYSWRTKARTQDRDRSDARPQSAKAWSSKARFMAVLETATMNAEQTAEYCRRRGLYPEQLAAWRGDCEQAGNHALQAHRVEAEQAKAQRARIRELERELRRKDAALAETAALLTLSKKAAVIWGDEA
jgi:transposase-like protein